MNAFVFLGTLALAATGVFSVPGPPTVLKRIACERSTLSLSCRDDKVIEIVSAVYGRNDRTTCPNRSIRTTSCRSPTSMSKVKESCEGKPNCRVSATNSVFGDPCRGTHKYLEVRYRCVTDIRSITCEHGKTILACTGGRTLDILSANYGRTDGTTCPHRSMKTKQCSAGSSLSKTRTLCQGKARCEVFASNSVFGDPCVGTFKYLDIRYRCSDTTRTIACENKHMSLSCPNGRVLRIMSANYGRTDRETCPHKSIKTTNCVSATSLNKVKELCDGQTSCHVTASNKVFDDTCVGTYKYLDVTHRCVVATRKVSCEHKTMRLSCRSGQILNIISATYGRSDRTTCKNPSIKTTQCAAASSLSKVRQQCQDKRSCRVTASNGVFGDPCRGTFKYLTVTYECAAVRSSVACERSTMVLSCPSNTLLKIIEANYGRTDRKTCPSKYIRTTKCSAASSLPTVRQKCQDKTRCDIVAANRVFGDPCVGTHKYLRVAYQCDDNMRSTTCENKKVQLSCGSDRSLHIVSANYGRSDRTTCPHRSIKTTSCAESTSLAKVRALCEGKVNCVVTASNGVFGDPCRGTYKYLNITYLCLA